MLKLLLWLLLYVLCWPAAILAVEGVFSLLRGILLLPARPLAAPR